MSANPQKNDESQEIDLTQISKKIGGFFENISTSIFKSILFFKRNIIWISILLAIGVGLGYYFDKTTKEYNHQIILIPNFGSVDYLYAKIDLINSKISENDTVFLKNEVGIKFPKKLKKIEITPITDVYKFIENKNQNFDLLKLMAEDGNIKKVIAESTTSKNYPYHLLSYTTSQQTTQDLTVKPLLDYLNNSEYYKTIQKEYLNNIKIKMVQNDSTISQINGVLNSFSKTVNGNPKSDKLVYYNENSQLNDVIKTKDVLVYEQGTHRIELYNLEKIVKDSSITLNIKNNNLVNGKMKIVFPFLFIFIFILIGNIKSFYKKQLSKLNS